MNGIDNIGSPANLKYILLRNRYDYCQCCMLGEYSECDGLIQLDGCDYCDIHCKYLKKSSLRVSL